MNTSSPNSRDYILIHGAWHGAWCWEKVTPLLTEMGHAVHTIDLPGLGDDETALADVSLDAYVSEVTSLINSIGLPVVLVGHSMGGMVITQVAEKILDKIHTLIYLTAFSPMNGEALL